MITTRRLCKSYGNHQVLREIDLQLEPGKIIGFLGPNGAGKTTTIRILLGLLSASSGEAQIFGKPCRSRGKEIRAEVGYLPGDVHLYPQMTGRATLSFFAKARKKACTDEIDRLANVFQLDLDKRVRSYSTGMRQKLGLIQALMHKPRLLILDEPTSALDPLIRNSVFDELRQVNVDGRSVLFSSHSLDEVESLCNEVVILRDGTIVEHQQVEVLKSKALRRVEIAFSDDQAIPADLPKSFGHVEREKRILRGAWSGPMSGLVKWLDGFQIDDLIVERPDLNDLFLTYYASDSQNESAEEQKGQKND